MIQLISQEQFLQQWQIFMILQNFLVKEEFIHGHKLTSKWHLVADGVDPTQVYNILSNQSGAIDRAFASLDTIKDDIVFWSAGSKPLELVKSGEVSMALAYNGRVGAAILSEGENFEYMWHGQVLEQEYIVS